MPSSRFHAWAGCLLILAGPALAAPLEPHLREATAAFDALRGVTDPAVHASAGRRLDELAAEAPDHSRVLALRAWQAQIRHEFSTSLTLADAALAVAPGDGLALGLRADALTELGRYPEAIAAVEALAGPAAGLPAQVRAAHLRRLHGDAEGARELLEAALGRLPPGHRERPWLTREVAALRWHGGDAAAALAALATLALDDLDALALRARILERDDPPAARAQWRQLADALPRPDALVGLWRTTADPAERRRLAHRLAGMARLDEAQGGLARRDIIDFYARSGRVADAIELARREYQRRPDVFSAGQLAWVLALAGQRDEAGARAREAARLGTRDRDLQDQLAVAAPAHTPPLAARQSPEER
jgi:tetratricopeptide (TPR) repeat protein